jgi:uncharacterized protein with GYD domain
MHTYLTFFTYSKETWRAMVQKPEDRSEAARKVIEAAGGHLVAFYWMLGQHDGLAIFQVAGPEDAAAVSAAISASGRIAVMQTHQLLSSEEASRVLQLAQVVTGAYEPPGGLTEWRAGYDQLG